MFILVNGRDTDKGLTIQSSPTRSGLATPSRGESGYLSQACMTKDKKIKVLDQCDTKAVKQMEK